MQNRISTHKAWTYILKDVTYNSCWILIYFPFCNGSCSFKTIFAVSLRLRHYFATVNSLFGGKLKLSYKKHHNKHISSKKTIICQSLQWYHCLFDQMKEQGQCKKMFCCLYYWVRVPKEVNLIQAISSRAGSGWFFLGSAYIGPP